MSVDLINKNLLIWSLLSFSLARVESHSRGYLLLRDSVQLTAYERARDSVFRQMDTLKARLNDNSDQMRRQYIGKRTWVS